MSKLILVTGGAGFIGSHLCKRLVVDGHKVISLDNYFTGSKDNHVSGVEYREGHTKDIESLISETPDLLFHLGEYSRVEKSFEDIEKVFNLNIEGTRGVVEFWRKRKCKVVYAGSSTKFADGGMGRDQSPYAWTKAVNTELVSNYGSWFNLPYAITYFYNVYGPGECSGEYGTVIEIFKKRFEEGKSLLVRAPGTQSRNFTHIEDIINGLVLVGEKGFGDNFGIGSPEAYSIIQVAQMFGNEIQLLPEAQGNRMVSVADTTKTELLGWAPLKSLPDYISDIRAR